MSQEENDKVSRRRFLLAITGSVVAVAAGCRPGSDQPAPTVYAPGSTPFPTSTAAPAPTGEALPDATWGDVTYDELVLTPVQDLYVTQYNYGLTPEVDGATWRLKIGGLVKNDYELTLEEVKALPVKEEIRTLECISNPPGGNLIGNLRMKGFDFSEILKRADVLPEATHVKFKAADHYETSVTLDWLTQPNVMLAYEMNDEPLTVRHGYPLRIMTPGLYGQKMPRWLTEIEFIDYDFRGYWESRGWSNVASVQTKSIIRTPNNGAEVKAGSIIVIQGIAFAGKRKITNIEVQVENGEWMPATIVYGESPLAWTQWYINWTVPAPGAYRIGVRATDEEGFVQKSEGVGIFGDAYPNGTNAIHRMDLRGV